jgi:hypothetical protein
MGTTTEVHLLSGRKKYTFLIPVWNKSMISIFGLPSCTSTPGLVLAHPRGSLHLPVLTCARDLLLFYRVTPKTL